MCRTGDRAAQARQKTLGAVALLGLVLLGPALAAAAYAVVLPTTGEGAGG